MSFPNRHHVDSRPLDRDIAAPGAGGRGGAPDDGPAEDSDPEGGAAGNGAYHQRLLERWRSNLLRLNRFLQEILPLTAKNLVVRSLQAWSSKDWSVRNWAPGKWSSRSWRPPKGLSLNRLSLNRGDLLLLLAGVVAFFVFTFLPGVVPPGSASGRAGAHSAASPYLRSAELALPGYAVPPDTFPWSGKETPTTAPAAQEPPPSLPSYPPAAAPTRIVYPAAGLDVVIHPLAPTREELESQAIVPPITVDGYWVSDFGMPGAGSTNTTYILGHSWEGRDAPFNRLSAASVPGDIFEATTASGTMRYRVESVDTYVKASLKDSPIWTAVPNRLVLISCYTEDPWGKNVVVIASPVPSP
ncbi:class F sortase [Arthrobacter sp. ISL-69]|uniref:class F sortase n=1 Tax=Arthrobacter sp. ISL-69 TaxID=2819113 RepID=UPI001BE8FFD8|nr:class F sortase [Arthrobacter sp. ISL-69]MBT2535280.1 class F sortase [Arthrobacter sp. ISL-69]